jgi:hypothetical protein
MPVEAINTWKCGPSGPNNVDALRAKLTELAKKKAGKDLISTKFTKDHIFAGHGGSVEKLAAMLAKLRDLEKSTLLITSMDKTAQAEVLNWIKKVPARGLTYANGTWTIGKVGTAVPGVASYKWATVDLKAFKGMDPDDRIKKARNWLTISTKTPKVACSFSKDGKGIAVIYHLDY